ncbi:MAG: hypothetical protein LBC96_06335 [Lachnospiraceae bacterium]|jgi:hypothetical protein|nr:hypothetical protein [Lachnospiraceae bacterium]
MNLIRYDGTRLLTETDVDRDFEGKTVLLDCERFPNLSKGYLVASVDTTREQVELLDEIKMNEYNGGGMIITGSKEKGGIMLGQYS